MTLGGQTFSRSTGRLAGRSSAVTVTPRGGRYVFALPAHSAVLVTF